MDEVNPEKIEEEFVSEASQTPTDPIAAASTMFAMYQPIFKQRLKKLSVRARSRVFNHLIEYPLNHKAYSKNSQEEKELIDIGHAVLEAKFLMILSTMAQGFDQLAEAADPNIPADLTDEEKAELSNFMNPKNINKEKFDNEEE